MALPGDGLREGIVAALREELGDHLVDTHLLPQTDLWVRVTPESWGVTAATLQAHGFEYFCFLSGLDWLPSPYGKGEDDPTADPVEPDTEIRHGYTGGESRFQVFARVTDLVRHVSVTLKADVPDSMSVPTWIGTYAGANWHERETHEMFGIGFDGHPDLRNMYLPGEFEGFPLRKDFPLLARMVKPWPGIVDVEKMPAQEDEDETAPTADTAAGDAVEAATAPTVDASAPATDTDESSDAVVVDTPPVDGGEAPADDAEAAAVGEAVAEADATDDAVEPDGVPADDLVAHTIITESDVEAADAADDADEPRPRDDGAVEADVGQDSTTESTDADAAAPTPGPATEDHPDGLTGGDTEEKGGEA